MKKNYFSDKLKISRSAMVYTGGNGKTYLAIISGAGTLSEWALIPVEKGTLLKITKGDIDLVDFLRENESGVYKTVRSKRKIFRKERRRNFESVS